MTPIPVSMLRVKSNIDSKEIQKAVYNKVKKSAQGEALTLVKLFKQTVSTWEDKPKFEYVVEESGDNIRVRVWTEDKIYYFLDQGTKVRFATMSKDFKPKSTPGWIGSGPGAGQMLYVNTERPRPGIESRRWTEVIYERRRTIAVTNLSQIVTDEVSKYWRRLWGG